MKKIFLIVICFVFSLSVVFSARTDEIEQVMNILKEVHPNMYNTNSEEVFAKKVEALKKDAENLDKFSYLMRLSEIVALVNDSHTSISINSGLDKDGKLLPLGIKKIGDSFYIVSIDESSSEYLGKEIKAINTVSMDDMLTRISPYISHDNEVWLTKQIIGAFSFKQVLDFISVSTVSDTFANIELADGENFNLGYVSMDEDIKISKLSSSYNGITKADKSKNFFYQLDGSILYIQYNRCIRDEEYPFSAMMDEALKENFDTIVVDLRNNGGGSDGVIWPLFEYLDKHDVQLYCLIGENTFSSAIINACQLNSLYDAVLIGTPTGGSVNHFGSVKGVKIGNGIKMGVSTKFIDLDAYLNSSYGITSLSPDIESFSSIDDLIKGRDKAYETVRKARVYNFLLSPYQVN